MDRHEAISALDNGKTLTHTHFAPYEWVRGIGGGIYEFEDGVKCTNTEFWMYRTDSAFGGGLVEFLG